MTTTALFERGSPTDTVGTVVLGFGPQPMDWISKAAKLCGRDAVMDQDVARMAGATMAAGAPAALAILRQRLKAGALQEQQQQHPNLSLAAAQWLATGERGMSSEAMFQHLTGVPCTRGRDWLPGRVTHPRDPADLRRCRLLLEQVPELASDLVKLRSLSDAWRGLVDSWAEICNAMDWETPDWRNPKGGSRAPMTYQLIKKAIGKDTQQ